MPLLTMHYLLLHREVAADRAERASCWMKIIVTLSRVALLGRVLRQARETKANNVTA